MQLTKYCQNDSISVDHSQFVFTGFSGVHAYTHLDWLTAPQAACLLLEFTDDGDAPYNLSYSPGGLGTGASIVGVDGSVGGAWSILVTGP